MPFELSEGERASKSIPVEKDLQNGWHGAENYGSEYTSTTESLARVANSCNGPGVSIAMAHSPIDPDCIKSSGCDSAVPPTKTRKIMAERSEPRKYVLQGNVFPCFISSIFVEDSSFIFFPLLSHCLNRLFPLLLLFWLANGYSYLFRMSKVSAC